MPTIVDAKWVDGYRIQLQFADGANGVVDLSRLAGKGVFSLWKDPAAFRSFSIGRGRELRWSDEVDLCADSLYMEITGKTSGEVFANPNEVPVDA
jgi:hypothetical protein